MADRCAMATLMCHVFLLQLIILINCLTPAWAQVTTTITPDASLGTQVGQNGATYTINGGTIRGPNQFHSFDRFDVGTGDTALFTGPSAVDNILSRVTGGSTSMIDGTLQSDIPRVNLFLLNPAGVVFGRNARLEVNGSFHVSIADRLQLGEDAAFHVSLNGQNTLSVSAPSAFGFLPGNASDMRIEGRRFIRIEGGRLEVPTGQTMSIIGGDIEIVGAREDQAPATLAAPNGQLHLVSVALPEEAIFLPFTAESGVLTASAERFGSIALIDNALVDVSGAGAGTVRVRGAQLEVDDAWIRADTEGDLAGGLIDVQVDTLRLSSGGKLSINTRNGSSSPESAGRVSIVATDHVTLSGSNSRIESINSGSGDAGLMAVRTGRLSISGSSKITTETTADRDGNAGHVSIRADYIEMDGGGTRIRSMTRGRGHAGRVDIEADHLQVARGRIQASTLSSSTGNAGDVMITADTVIVETGGHIASVLRGSGEGGRVDLNVRDLIVRSEGRVTTSAERDNLTLGFESGDAGTPLAVCW